MFQGVREQLDHVLVSEQFYDHSWHRYWSFAAQQIWNDHLYEGGPTGPQRPTTDHGIVCAHFAWDPTPMMAVVATIGGQTQPAAGTPGRPRIAQHASEQVFNRTCPLAA